MTKKEFIEAMKDMPDDAEIYFWNFFKETWFSGKPYFMKGSKYDYDNNNNKITNFIGIE